MIQLCWKCQSTFHLHDKIDIRAEGLQAVYCPVCNQEIWVSSGYMLPKRWVVGDVIKRGAPKGGVIEQQNFQDTRPKEAAQTAWNIALPDFTALGKGVAGGVRTGAIIAVVLLVLILIFAMRK